MRDANFEIVNTNEHYFRFPLDTFVEKQKELGGSRIVFWASVPHLWADQYGVEPHEEIFTKFFEAGIIIEAIAARPYNYTLFMDNRSRLGVHSMAYYRGLIDLAAEQGISLVAIELWGALRDKDRCEQYQNCCQALRALCQYAGQKGINLAVGNVSYSHSAMINTLPELKSLLEEADCENLLAFMDYGTAWQRHENVEMWIDTLGQRLCMIYLSNARNGGSGYPLSQGCCAIQRDLDKLRKAGFSGVIALRMSQDFCQQDPALVDDENWNYLNGK